MRQLIVVPDENKLDVYFYCCGLSDKDSYDAVLKEFICTYDDVGIISNHSLCFDYAKLGNLVISEDEIVDFFLPEIITVQQIQYLLSNKDELLSNKKGFRVHSIHYDSENDKYINYDVIDLDNEIENKLNDQKHIIVVPNEEILKVPNGIYSDSFFNNIGHAQKFEKFIKLYNLGIMIDDYTIGHEVSLQLANFGHLSICIEGKNLICYIPDNISKYQKNWFIENEYFINKYDAKGFYFDGRIMKTVSDKNSDSYEIMRKMVINKYKVLNEERKKR